MVSLVPFAGISLNQVQRIPHMRSQPYGTPTSIVSEYMQKDSKRKGEHV